MFKLCISFVVLISLCSIAEGMLCYSCTKSGSDNDMTCVNNPAQAGSQPIVKCSKRYCTIRRQERKDPPNEVASFFRGCEETPPKINGVEEDDDYITYFRACTDDLCNGGTGNDDISGGMLGDNNGNGVLFVKGLPGGANSLKISLFALITSIILFIN